MMAYNNRSGRNIYDKFVSPYTFVPLSDKEKSYCDKKEKRSLTGYIECKIIPKTDIFIPNSSYSFALVDNNKLGLTGNKKHKSYEFYSYNNIICADEKREAPEKPIIPGSEIRGVIRSVYESLTDSCMSVLENEEFSARYKSPKLPGLLKFDGEDKEGNKKWYIHPAKRYMLNTMYNGNGAGTRYNILFDDRRKYIQSNNNKYFNGDKIRFTETEDGYIKKKKDKADVKISVVDTIKREEDKGEKGVITGYLCLGEKFGKKKHHDSIFRRLQRELVEVNSDDIDRLKRILDDYYRNSKINRSGNAFNCYSDIKNFEIEDRFIPVWYEVVDGKVYISPAAIGRELYFNTQYNLAESYMPCNKEKSSKGEDRRVCSACSLFGTLIDDEKDSKGKNRDKKSKSIKSRVRVTDANIITNAVYQNKVTIKPLMGPKVSSFEFYTHIKDDIFGAVDYWNADYFVKGNSKKCFENGEIKLNGRKFFWHNTLLTQKKYVDDRKVRAVKEHLNATIRPLRASSNNSNIFKFKVYFDDISEKELKRLLFVLNLGNNNNNKCHKIGKGKAIGLGSIKILIDNVCFRTIDFNGDNICFKNEFKNDFIPEYSDSILNGKPEYFACDEKVYKAVLKVTDLNAIKEPKLISYPYVIDNNGNKGKIMDWFSKNRKTNNFTKQKFRQRLPKVGDDKQEIQVYRR